VRDTEIYAHICIKQNSGRFSIICLILEMHIRTKKKTVYFLGMTTFEKETKLLIYIVFRQMLGNAWVNDWLIVRMDTDQNINTHVRTLKKSEHQKH
jgi:hypothetical protein